MHGLTPESLFLEGSKSPDLAAALDLVADSEAQSAPKFTGKTCHLLGRMIVCRNYAAALHELCHLVILAEACSPRPGRYEAFFWGSGTARAEAFRSHLAHGQAYASSGGPAIELDGREAKVRYGDGVFAIAYSRMPVLSALMEFLVTVLGYGTVDDHCRALLTAGPSMKKVSQAANRIAKDLYDYLNQHLGSLHQHRTFSALIAYLRERQGGGFASEDIDDAAVLDFWEANGGGDAKAVEFRTFVSVFRAFLRLRQSLEAAAQAVALGSPAPIGGDRAQGEVDPAAVMSAVETVESRDHPLERLRRPPADRVKFLTKIAAADLELLIDCGSYAPVFALSVMRAEVFGAAQARITQACRGGFSGDALVPAIDGSLRQDYDGQRGHFEALQGQLRKILLASLFALVVARRPEAINLILTFSPQADLRSLGPQPAALAGQENVVAIDTARIVRRAFSVLAEGTPDCPELARLMRDAKRAFQSVSRRGFDEDSLKFHDIASGFAEGVEALDEIAQSLEVFREALGRPPPRGSWPGQFDHDAGRFLAQFHRIYGARV